MLLLFDVVAVPAAPAAAVVEILFELAGTDAVPKQTKKKIKMNGEKKKFVIPSLASYSKIA